MNALLKTTVTVALAVAAIGCGEPGGTTTEADVHSDDVVVRLACSVDADCAGLNDGDLCDGSVVCSSGVCSFDATSAVSCDTAQDTACAANVCEPVDGKCALKPRRDGLPCDDGAPCTMGDRCANGSCTAGPVNKCACQNDAECAGAGDACSGTFKCNLSVVPYRCEVVAGTAVQCPDDANPCTNGVCDSATGECTVEPLPDGSGCDDGDACTVKDACAAGKCAAGTDVCSCNVAADCPDPDGNVCTGVPVCAKAAGAEPSAKGTCKPNPTSAIACSTEGDSTCLAAACLPAAATCALVPRNENVSCADGDPCTVKTVCLGGTCAGGDDVCKCKQNSDCADQEDGVLCNGTLYCNKQTGTCALNPATVVHCLTVDDTACAKNVCVADAVAAKCEVVARANVTVDSCKDVQAGGVVLKVCTWRPLGGNEEPDATTFACEDGDACTKPDVCAGAACESGQAVCECTTNADCLGDGDLCNGVEQCNKLSGKCETVAATKVTCPAGADTSCSANTCNKLTGKCAMIAAAPETKCDDGEVCTVNDACKLGSCKPGVFVCECKHAADCKVKDDGNLCNGTWFCDTSGALPKCKPNPGSAIACSKTDDGPCQHAKCSPATGQCALLFDADGAACDDGKACTAKSKCKSGSCKGGTAKSCDDGDACSIDSCVATKGCAHKQLQCDDGNACTADKCDAATGKCSNKALATGASCDGDGDGCTLNDKCTAQGACKTGPKVQCPGKAGPCEVVVCASKSASAYACVTAHGPDGKPCPDNAGSCTTGASCKSGACAAGSKPRIYHRVVDPAVKGGSLRAVVVDHNDDAVAGGQIAVGGGKSRWWLTRLSKAGDVVWKAGNVSQDPGVGVGAVDVFRTPGKSGVAGPVWVAGTIAKGSKTNMLFARFSADGKVTGKRAPESNSSVSQRLFHADWQPDGRIATSFHTVSNGKLLNVGMFFDPVGKPRVLWSEKAASPTVALDIALGPKSGAMYTGLAFLEPEKSKYSVNAPDAGSGAFVSVADGNYAFVGRRFEYSTKTWSVVAGFMEATGPRISGQQIGDASLDLALAVRSNGGLVVSSHKGGDGWLAVTDDSGGKIAQTSVDGGGVEKLYAVAAGDSGDHVVAVGETTDIGGTTRGWLVRTDAWLHTTCPKAGSCAGKPLADCADEKPCTVDLCDAFDGCTHALLPDESVCKSTLGCARSSKCDAGKCVAGLHGKASFFRFNSFSSKIESQTVGFRHSPAGVDAASYRYFASSGFGGLELTTLSGLGGITAVTTTGKCKSVQVGRRFHSSGVYSWMMGEATVAGRKRVGFCRYTSASTKYTPSLTKDLLLPTPGPCKDCDVIPREFALGAGFYGWLLSDTNISTSSVVLQRLHMGTLGVTYTSINSMKGQKMAGTALDTDDSGDVFWVGYTGNTFASERGLLQRRNASGAMKYYVTAAGTSYGVRLYAVDALAGGHALAGGVARDDVKIHRRFVGRWDASGKRLWSWLPKDADMSAISSVLWQADGTFLTVFERALGTKNQIYFTRQSATTTVFEQLLRPDAAVVASASPGTLIAHPDGGWLLGASYVYADEPKGPPPNHGLFRISEWGPADCESLGDCVNKTAADCDDGKATTADACVAGKGCVHIVF